MNVAITRALLSVSDKTGIVELAKALQSHGVDILSTGGTAKALRDAGISLTEISDYTGVPEMMDGRVKTLVPQVHGGLLALRDNTTHTQAMQDNDIQPIDMLVVNLYPFEQTVAKGAAAPEVIEQIDIGGPAMVRSAAKNHRFVTVVTDPSDYEALLTELDEHEGNTTLGLRETLAAKAFARTAAYDSAISRWFAQQQDDPFPASLTVAATRKQSLRYGENPHQQAAFYVTGESVPGVATAEQIQGKELSYNNINDTDAAFELVSEFDAPTAAIIKHSNPCGVASAASLSSAYEKALASDPVSAFGGILAFNRPLDGETASHIASLFAEVVIAPAITVEAREVLASKDNLRVLVTGDMPDRTRRSPMMKSVAGGLLMQDRDALLPFANDLRTVTENKPREEQLADLLFAFIVCKHLKSNAIVIAKDLCTVGLGGGQTSRVDAVRQAVWQANELAAPGQAATQRSEHAVLASDAFFPFADNITLAAEAGIDAIIQPGGSKRDEEVIKAANAAGIAMVFTGRRHFKH